MKMYFINDSEPATSKALQPVDTVIPPFSHAGPLPATSSGLWSPPAKMLLTSCIIRATSTGTQTAVLEIVRVELGGMHTSLLTILLPAEEKAISKIFEKRDSMKAPVITPREPLMIKSLVESEHNDVVIQLTGEAVA